MKTLNVTLNSKSINSTKTLNIHLNTGDKLVIKDFISLKTKTNKIFTSKNFEDLPLVSTDVYTVTSSSQVVKINANAIVVMSLD